MHVRTIRTAALAALLCASPLLIAEDEMAAREAAAMKAAQTFMQELKGELTAAMKKGGPGEAINVCTGVAPAIAGRLSRENGWQVTRVGTRVRNPMLGTPDAWEQKVLADFAARAGRGESLEKMKHSEVVKEPGGEYFRFMKAIGTAPQCLACHGEAQKIAAPVKAKLQENYPFDRATGYQSGDLRGAVSIKQPLDIELVRQTGAAPR